MCGECVDECGGHVGCFGSAECAGGDQVTGMVIDDVEDFDVGAVSQGPVCGVCLPAFVGEVRFETDVGGVGSFLWFGVDEPAAGQDPPDRRG